jgi:hypothetical protein
MTTHHTAQGLASLGRHGDTMLVHMSPHEVAGLNYLAKKQGTKLTINPETGLPEAFSLGGFFSSLLPVFAGAMVPGSWGAMAPLLAGAATGAGLSAAKGENPLMGGIMGGLGGYSGAGLANSLSAAANPLSTAGGWVPGKEIAQSALPNAAGMADSGALSTIGGAGNIGNPALSTAQNTLNQTAFTNSALSGSGNIVDPALNRLSTAGTGLKNIVTSQPGAWDAFKAAGGSGMKLAMPVGGAILGGLEPSDIYGEPIKPSGKDKYDPYATLNLGNDTGLRLVAKGGYIDGYAVGGTVTTGGLRDLYSATDTQTNPALSRDGYGVGRLDSLAREQSLNQAQTMGYAMGGPVSFADGGDANKDAMGLPTLSTDINMAPNTGMTPTTEPANTLTDSQLVNIMQSLGPFKGGGHFSYNISRGANQGSTPSSDDSLITKVTANLKADPNYQPTNPIEASIVKQIKGTDQAQQGQGLGSLAPSQPMAPSYNPSVAMGPTYYAGMNAPRGYAHGGYLDGQGDGMSDSIPATIEGKQPARLADGEFVVPADVVSHIGNGSSKAGSKRLYSMLDRVRKARTGHTKQGKEIKPEKYMPA